MNLNHWFLAFLNFRRMLIPIYLEIIDLPLFYLHI
jgi:hypothetical protein